jgi:hypothetical protein
MRCRFGLRHIDLRAEKTSGIETRLGDGHRQTAFAAIMCAVGPNETERRAVRLKLSFGLGEWLPARSAW